MYELDFSLVSPNTLAVARVVIEHLSKTFAGAKPVCALADVNLTVQAKELLVLVGPSGCGKTTLLRVLAGLEEPSAGSIWLDGQPAERLAPKDRDVAMVFQNSALYPHLSVYENMAFGLKLRRVPRAEVARRVEAAVGMLELKDCLERKPMELSGGQRQRVALGRALVRQPKVLLLDEPLSNLDAPMRVQLREVIKQLHVQLGSTMVYVTHDQAEAMLLGDRIAVMQAGALQQVATPLELYRQPANRFVAGFIGSPAMNFFPGELAGQGGCLVFHGRSSSGTSALKLQVDNSMTKRLEPWKGKPVILGLRPENITLDSSGTPMACRVEVMVTSVEQMGAETYLRMAAGVHSFVARIPASDRLCQSQKLSVSFDMRAAHFFDPESGKATC